MATQVPANPQAERQRIYRSIVLRAQRLRIHGAIVSVYGRLTTALRQRRPDLENFIWFDMADMLSPEFETQVKALADEIIHNSALKRAGAATRSQIETTVSAVAANLIRAIAVHPTCYVAVRMGPQFYTASRYNCQNIGFDNLYRTISYMRECVPALISYHGGFFDRQRGTGKATRIQATRQFLQFFKLRTEASLIFSIAQNPKFEYLHLKDRNKKIIDYADTDQTERMRARLDALTKFANRHWADLYVTDEQFRNLLATSNERENGPDGEPDQGKYRQQVDLNRRRLYRVFNNSTFEDGGRLYGGWWQSIPSRWRPYITIDWCPTRELDYSSMQPAMIYAMAGLPLDFDAYEIDGIPETDANRNVIKITLLKIINATAGMSSSGPKTVSNTGRVDLENAS